MISCIVNQFSELAPKWQALASMHRQFSARYQMNPCFLSCSQPFFCTVFYYQKTDCVKQLHQLLSHLGKHFSSIYRRQFDQNLKADPVILTWPRWWMNGRLCFIFPQFVWTHWGGIHSWRWECVSAQGTTSSATGMHPGSVLSALHKGGAGNIVITHKNTKHNNHGWLLLCQ